MFKGLNDLIKKDWMIIGGSLFDTSNNVIPRNDLKSHIEGLCCACAPLKLEGIVVHNSYDGREFFEETNKNLIKNDKH